MTLSANWSLSAEAGEEAQLQMEAEVRRMLRRANDTFALASVPLAQSLCEVTGIPNVRKALQHVIAKAFQEVGAQGQLSDVLLVPGLEGSEAGRPATQRIPVSRRHLQRRRAKAVSILALHIRKLVGMTERNKGEESDGGPPDPLEAIAELFSDIEPAIAARIFRLGGPQSAARANALAARACVDLGANLETAGAEFKRHPFSPLFAVLEAQSKQLSGDLIGSVQGLWPLFTRAARDVTDGPEVRFELEWLGFLRARHRGCVRQMERVATNLSRIARDHPSGMLKSLLAQAEARIRRGHLYDGVILLDQVERFGYRKLALRQLACSSLLRAEIALQRGDDAAAERLAAGSHAALRGRHRDAYLSQAAVARASLRLGKSWTCGKDLDHLPAAAWHCVAIRIEEARHLTACGSADDGRQIARDSYQIASSLDYTGLAARAAAAIGQTFGRGTQQRRQWYLRALSLLFITRDRSIGCDLFVREQGCDDAALFELFDDALPKVIYAALQRSIPQLACASEFESAAVLRFLKYSSAYVLGFVGLTDELIRAIEAVSNTSDSFSQYLVYFSDDVTEILEVGFAAMVSIRESATMDERFTRVFRHFARAVQPRDDVRNFLVGQPVRNASPVKTAVL